jgi:hypothetical protein
MAATDVIQTISVLVAVVFAIVTIITNRKTQQKNIASETWRDYEKISFEHPQFSMREKTIDFLAKKLVIAGQPLPIDAVAQEFFYRENFFKYQWYISIMLLSCEEVLKNKLEKDWETALKHQMRIHEIFINSDYFVDIYYDFLSPKLQFLVKTTVPALEERLKRRAV